MRKYELFEILNEPYLRTERFVKKLKDFADGVSKEIEVSTETTTREVLESLKVMIPYSNSRNVIFLLKLIYGDEYAIFERGGHTNLEIFNVDGNGPDVRFDIFEKPVEAKLSSKPGTMLFTVRVKDETPPSEVKTTDTDYQKIEKRLESILDEALSSLRRDLEGELFSRLMNNKKEIPTLTRLRYERLKELLIKLYPQSSEVLSLPEENSPQGFRVQLYHLKDTIKNLEANKKILTRDNDLSKRAFKIKALYDISLITRHSELLELSEHERKYGRQI